MTHATAGTRKPGSMAILTADGRLTVVVTSRSERSMAGRYWNAVQHFLATGDSTRLDEFRDVIVAGHELLTDLDLIEELARRGQLEFESIYRSVR
jgi:hypothetical protein